MYCQTLPITTSIWSSYPSGGRDFSTVPQKFPADAVDTCVYVDIINNDDEVEELYKNFTLTLTVDGHPGVTFQATVIIVDDDNYYTPTHDRKLVTLLYAQLHTVCDTSCASGCMVSVSRGKLKREPRTRLCGT